MSNPTRLYPGNFGTPFIFAMRNGYGTADWSLFKNQLDALQTQVNNLNNAINSIQNNGARWVEVRVNDNQMRAQNTGWACSDWSKPVLSTASPNDDSGFQADVFCDGGTWRIAFENSKSALQWSDWVSFRGKRW
jgi:hypothetical protein